jgi:retron-type reverse transcriptase
MALVRPVLKKACLDVQLMKNFRPVSNLSFLSKVIEKAYRKYHSTETAFLKVHDDVWSALDEDYTVVLIMLDLSAAFDTINHGVLFALLQERYSVRGQVLAWIQSYLSSQSWTVVVEGQERELSYGVPQGSILGPLLFIMYIAPLGDLIHRHGNKDQGYADDRQLYMAFKQANIGVSLSSLEQCISEVRSWMRLDTASFTIRNKRYTIYYFSPKFILRADCLFIMTTPLYFAGGRLVKLRSGCL